MKADYTISDTVKRLFSKNMITHSSLIGKNIAGQSLQKKSEIHDFGNLGNLTRVRPPNWQGVKSYIIILYAVCIKSKSFLFFLARLYFDSNSNDRQTSMTNFVVEVHYVTLFGGFHI